MKKTNIFFLLLGLFQFPLFAVDFYAKKIDSSATNIPTSFDKTNASSLISTGVTGATHLEIVNHSNTRIAVNFSSGDSSNNPTLVEMYVPPNGGSGFTGAVRDGIKVSSRIYIKSDGSAISSGIVTVSVW